MTNYLQATDSRLLLIYVSGPYSAPTPEEVAANVERARAAACELMRLGYAVICPHTMTAGWEREGLTYEQFIAADLEIVRRCDAVLLLPGWEDSKGALAEKAMAERAGVLTFPSISNLRLRTAGLCGDRLLAACRGMRQGGHA